MRTVEVERLGAPLRNPTTLASLATVSPALWPAPSGHEMRALLSAVGLSDELVAAVVGISSRTLRRWMVYGLPADDTDEKETLLSVLNVVTCWLASHAPNVFTVILEDFEPGLSGDFPRTKEG